MQIDIPLTFSPSPNISVGQEAVYNCYNGAYLESVWYINGETLEHPSNADRSDITAIGIGTSNVTLMIDGLIENDRTTVQCVVFGLVNGIFQSNTSDIYTLFIQGM